VTAYRLRLGSGGRGRYRGGDGIVREVQLLAPVRVSLLSERRRHQPYGLAGGAPARPGENFLLRRDRRHRLAGKVSFDGEAGDRVIVLTPGGGGWGRDRVSRRTRSH
jgi:N-methylhydantoinase B